MKYFNLKFQGTGEGLYTAFGNQVMCETEFAAYKSEVHNFFERKEKYLYIGNGCMMKWESENEFWKTLEIAPISLEESDFLEVLGLHKFGTFPSIEFFIK